MAFFTEGPLPLDMIAREAEGSRSRDAVTVTGNELLPPGTLLSGEIGGEFTQASGAGDVSAILLYWADPREGPIGASALTRDCEVNDAYLVYRDLDPVAVAESLREHGIILRLGVLVNPATEFAMSRAPWPSPPGAAFATGEHGGYREVGALAGAELDPAEVENVGGTTRAAERERAGLPPDEAGATAPQTAASGGMKE